MINAWTNRTTQIRYIEGTESITGCVDQNQNESCDAGEASGELRLKFNRVASVDASTGSADRGLGFHRASSSSGHFAGGLLRIWDLPGSVGAMRSSRRMTATSKLLRQW